MADEALLNRLSVYLLKDGTLRFDVEDVPMKDLKEH